MKKSTFIFNLLATTALATGAKADVISGTGWSFDPSTGLLEITGAISSDGSVDSTNAPWTGQVTLADIQSINFGEGVTSISGFEFPLPYPSPYDWNMDYYYNVNSVSFPSTLKTIASGAFQNAVDLYSITFNTDATGLSIGDDAFTNLSSLSLSDDFHLPDNTSFGQNVFNYFNESNFFYTKDDNGVYIAQSPDDWDSYYYYSSADRMFRAKTTNCSEQDCIEEGCETPESCAAVVAARNVSNGGTDNDGAGGSGTSTGGSVTSEQNTPKRRIYTVQEATDRIKELGTDTVNFRIRYK